MNKISSPSPSIIVTLKLDENAQSFFNEQRTKYFPAHCNYVDAHITLFHKLPSNNLDVENVLEKFAQRTTFDICINEIVLQNTGVAYQILSDELMILHKQMQEELQQYLIRNDLKKLWPHITIQNKVTAYKAYKTHAVLIPFFEPFNVMAIGFTSWYYVKGYWEKKGDYLFG